MVKFKLKSCLILLSLLLVLLWLIFKKMDLFDSKNVENNYSDKKFKTFFAPDTIDTWPYVSNTNFLLLSDYIYVFDEKTIQIDQLKNNDIIFVQNNLINEFFLNIFTKINSKFILITSHGDVPDTNEQHLKYLNDDKLLVWFASNPPIVHNKMIPIPIGLDPKCYQPLKIKILKKVMALNKTIPWIKRKYLLYINLSPGNGPGTQERLAVISQYKGFKNVFISTNRIKYRTYLKHLQNSKYVICPRGGGLDSYRVYESILMGSIPIVKNTTLSPIYSESTVLVVSDLTKLTVDILENPSSYIKNMNFSKEIVMMKTWQNKINSFKNYYI